MQQRVCHLTRMRPPINEDEGLLSASGPTVPTNGTTNFQTGCIFQHTDGAAGTAFYINEGDEDSCTFVAVAGLTAAQEALLGATAGVATASKALILDVNGAIASGTMVLTDMAAGAGVSAGSGTICEHSVSKIGGLFKTEIFIDLTGLHGGGANDDIIGVDAGAVNCHIGQITAAKNGTIRYGQITCLETPAGGDPDVDLWGSVDEATGAQDALVTALTGEVQLLDHGDWSAAVATPVALSALPDADGYLYLANGAFTDAAYSAGQFLIEFWGT